MGDTEYLAAYYTINSTLMIEYKYSLAELEDMLPWEREYYIVLLEQHMKEKNEEISRQIAGGKREFA